MKWSRISMLTMCLALSVALVAVAQQPGGRRGGRGGFGGGFGGGGFGGFGGGGLTLLGDDKVRDEIGLSDDKYQQIQDDLRASFQEMGNLFQGGFQDLSDDERQSRFEESRKKMADAQKKIEEKHLTAAQRKRLKELSVQSRLNRGGTGEGIASDEIASELGLTDADKEKVRQAADDAQEDLRAKIQKLQDDARAEVIKKSLSPAQQAKLEQMMGKKFEFSNNVGGFAGFGGGGGGAGGRPGFGGRGGPGGPGGFGGGRGGPGAGGRPARPPVERLPDGD